MARILLCWEFGGGRGHCVRLHQIGRALRARGHGISYALQRIDGLDKAQLDGAQLWQAPLSPRLLISVARPVLRPAATMGDILARIGLDDPEIVSRAIAAWEGVLGAFRPDVVIGDYAPLLALAAAGRVPVLLIGTGFDLPPIELPCFPRLADLEPVHDEEATLAAVNKGLQGVGRPPIGRLPAVFSADARLAGTFSEIDPYAHARSEPQAAPTVPDPPPTISVGGGEEVFVYAPESVGADSKLWAGLEASKLPVRIHLPRTTRAYREQLEKRGFTMEERPLPFQEIIDRSRLLVSHGGHGFVCSGLLAGIPQIVCHHDLEKFGHGRSIARLQLGGHVPLQAIAPEPFGASLRRIYEDEAIAARARTAATGFQARLAPGFVAQAVKAAEALL